MQTSILTAFDNVSVSARDRVSQTDRDFVDSLIADGKRIRENLEAWAVGLRKLAGEIGESKAFENDDDRVSVNREVPNWKMESKLFTTMYGQTYIDVTLKDQKEVLNAQTLKYFADKYLLKEIADFPVDKLRDPWHVVERILHFTKSTTLEKFGEKTVIEKFKLHCFGTEPIGKRTKNKITFNRFYTYNSTTQIKRALKLFETGTLDGLEDYKLPFYEAQAGQTYSFESGSKLEQIKIYLNKRIDMVFASENNALEFLALFKLPG